MRGCLFFLLALLVLSAGCGTMAPRESLPAWEQLHMAAGAGNLVGAMQVAQRGVDVNVRDPQGCTALMAAAIQGRSDVVRWLLAKGADVELSSYDGLSPMICAAFGGHGEVIRLLAAKGAAVNTATPPDGLTPAMYAVLACQPSALTALAQAGADLQARNAAGDTALR